MAGVVLFKFFWSILVLGAFSKFIPFTGGTILIFPLLLVGGALITAIQIIRGKKFWTRITAVIYVGGMIFLALSSFADPLFMIVDGFVTFMMIRAALAG